MKMVIITEDKKQTVVQSVAEATYKVGAGAQLNVVLPVIDSKIVDYSVIVELYGRGAKATITGIVIGKSTNEVRLHTLQHHIEMETTSDLLIKGVLFDGAKLAYDGKIVVDKKAQKTDAYQRNENLLMSPEARAVSKPGLEILANDVRCTHGATVGMVNQEQIWYLNSRGLDQSEAEKLIVDGFVASSLERITDKAVRMKLMEKL